MYRALCLLVAVSPLAADPPTRRVPWTASRLTGSPDPPPQYATERVFPKLKFDQPVTLTRDPASGRLFVVELGGKLVSFPDDPTCDKPEPFLDLTGVPNFYRAYGLAFPPTYPTDRHVYVCYVLKPGHPAGSRVSRFAVAGDPPRADPASEAVLLEWPSGGHNGGCLQFGPDGFLYISTGDGSNPHPPDALNTGQDIGDLLASVLRIDVSRTDGGKPYAVPADNPFVRRPGARPEVWAYGLRNPWKMAFDPAGRLWVGDVGWELWEMLYRVEKGGNYGWSVAEGRQPVKSGAAVGPTPIRPPVVEHPHTEARSLTGGRVYRGSRLPELTGAYVYGDYVTGKLWALRFDGSAVMWRAELADSPLAVIDFGEGSDNELYVLDHAGTVHRIVRNPATQANNAFPRRLSETGLFASVKDHTPAPGVLPYEVNAEPWADHATAERLIAVPGKAALGVHRRQQLDAGIVKGEWDFPPDTVFAKTVSQEAERGNPATRRRLETQVLHRDRGTWRAYNFVWTDDQSDAVLDGPGGSDRPGWHHAGRTDCLVCHTTRAGSILGFNLGQLNRERNVENQLLTFARFGLFADPLPDPLPRLPSPHDPSASIEERARAYLHVNCGSCHRRGGGGTAAFELVYGPPLAKLLLVDALPSQGTFDLRDARTVAAGDPYRSVLYLRMAKLGAGRMPHLGSTVVDERGLDLIHEWIRGLPTPGGESASVEKSLATPNGALALLRAIDTGRVTGSRRIEVLAAARTHPSVAVRDLFERFVPEAERVKRLGPAFPPAAVLGLAGDPSRGRQVFFHGVGVQCRNCHKVGGEGQEVGPDLSKVGAKADRAMLLESLTDPSKVVDPAFAVVQLETASGAVHSGLLVRRTAAEVVLKDAQGKVITIPAGEVERLTPQRASMMPDQLLRDLTAQQAADLLAFLSSQK